MSIVVNEVSKSYGTQLALNKVSFEVHPGEIVAFLGPNGAGKSTLMKILTGFIPPSSGGAEVAGYSVRTKSMEVRKRVGYLPEHNPLYPDMYVREYLSFTAALHGIGKGRKARVEAMIKETGLSLEAHKKVGALSKGYRQRLGLAAAIIHDPEVLILDEPTSGLDPNQLVEIRQLIRNLGQNKTLLLSTHILKEVEAVCHRVLILDRGQLKANERLENLSKSNQTEGSRVWAVGFDTPLALSQIKKIAGVDRAQQLDEQNFLIESASGKAFQLELSRWALDQGIALNTLTEYKQELEEVFRKYTGPKS